MGSLPCLIGAFMAQKVAWVTGRKFRSGPSCLGSGITYFAGGKACPGNTGAVLWGMPLPRCDLEGCARAPGVRGGLPG